MKILLPFLLLPLCGCAYLTSVTTSYDPGTGTATERTRVRVYTFFDSKSQLTKFRNSNGGVASNGFVLTAGTSIGSLSEGSSSTNLNDLLGAAVGAAVKAGIMAREAQPQQPTR